MCTHTPLLNYYSYPLQHTYPRYFERLISLMASHFYLLSHVLFKNNIPFQEFSLLPSRWCSELCPPGLSAVRAFGEKMLGFLELRMSLGSVHKWMTAWLDTTVRVVPRSLENTQNVNPVIFFAIDWSGEFTSSRPSPCLENCFPRSSNVLMVFTY